MKKTRTIEVTESYKSCDFCDKPARYDRCFICGSDMCEDHRKEFDVINYDLVYICPDCEHKDYTKLRTLNNKYMRLCKVGENISKQIRDEINKLNETDGEKYDSDSRN